MAAKLLHPSLFCADINIKTIIDIVIYDEQHLLITSSFFIKRYNVSDQKQVNSWITRSWFPFTAAAIKDPENENIHAVINKFSVCHWPLEEKFIENVKKSLFTSQIEALVPGINSIYVLYSCGFTELLKTGLKRRKELKKELLKKDETIVQYRLFEEKFMALFVTNKNNENFLYQVKISSGEAPVRIHIKLDNLYLTGSSIFSSGKLLTSWSDGSLYSLNVFKGKYSHPGLLKGKLTSLKASKKLKILELSRNHIAFQGMNSNEEGGLVLLWDTKFGLAVSSKPLKMYLNPPLAWSVGFGLIICDGGSLVYIPVSLSPSTVASMFGSRVNDSHIEYEECIGWKKDFNEVESTHNEAMQTIFSHKSNELREVIRSLQKGSASEDIIVDIVVSKLIEEKNVKMLSECYSSFKFISEKSLVSIVKFYIGLEEDRFSREPTPTPSKKPKKNKASNGLTPKTPKNGELKASNHLGESPIPVPLTNGFQEDERLSELEDSTCPFSPCKSRAINEVLAKPFAVSELSRAMYIFDFASSFSLLEYLRYLLTSGQASLVEEADKRIPTIEKCSTWLSLLLDANYHQYVMSSENKVQKQLSNFYSDVSTLMEFLESSQSLDTLVERVLSSKPLPVTKSDRPYSIERLSLR